MNRRDQIAMTDAEVQQFLSEHSTLICASNGADGWPHLMPLWYALRDGTPWSWTFAKSQKVKNLQRNARATVAAETGTTYQDLRGVMLKCEVVVHDDFDTVLETGLAVAARQGGVSADAITGDLRDMLAAQARKRVALEFVEVGRATWDHRKLAAGVY